MVGKTRIKYQIDSEKKKYFRWVKQLGGEGWGSVREHELEVAKGV